jgi:hypothetical protein
MALESRRDKVRAAVLAVASGAVIATAAVATLGPAAAAGRPSSHASAVTAVSRSGLPIVVNCAGQDQTRPASYILACGDTRAYLTKLQWAAWGQTDAFGNGTFNFKACLPTCSLHSFPVLVALWAAKPLPGHPGTRFFTSMTLIFTGNRRYTAGGKRFREPQTATYPLSPSGGA